MLGSIDTAPLASDIPVQNLDSGLQDMLRNFHTTGDRIQRSAMATEMAKLADAGVPKPQIASGLGYLFRDENSVEVETDILNELGKTWRIRRPTIRSLRGWINTSRMRSVRRRLRRWIPWVISGPSH